MLAGFTFSFFWAHSMTGLSPQGIADHYRGSDATFGEPMSFRELAEITHFHLFTMPVVFMILVHVLYLTSASSIAESHYDLDVIRWGHVGPAVSLAHQLRLAHIRAHHADGGYPHDRSDFLL